MTMSRHLVTCLPEEDLLIGSHQTPSQVFLSNIRNWGNNELSKWSGCSVHRRAKVSSAEECDQERTRRPTLFKELFPYQDITGLSSAKSHGKIVANAVFLSPARSINASNTTKISPANYYQQLSKASLSPTEYCFPARSLEYFSPRRVIPFAKIIPQRSHLLLPVFLQSSSPAEVKAYSSTSAQEWLPGTRQGFTFLDENIHC